jgi:hypothetical protein
MKAVFGKSSIFCFVVFLVSTGISVVYYWDSGDVIWSGLGVLAFTFGLLFGYLSALKQETPKYYRYIGFLLYYILILFVIYVQFTDFVKNNL